MTRVDNLWRYYSSFQSFRGRVGGLPSWARTIVLIAAVPGALLIALSILALLVSILALLLLTVPLYRLLRALTGTGRGSQDMETRVERVDLGDLFGGGTARRRVEATVIDPDDAANPEDGEAPSGPKAG